MLEALRLYTFRNYDDQVFSFSPGINGVFGPNGSGKTNILEAISLISTGRSFRNASTSEMTNYNAQGFSVDGRIDKKGLPTKMTLQFDGTQKKTKINTNEYSYFSAVLGNFPTVFYVPRDMSIITAAPADRRRFWNILLSQASPIYLHHLTRYTRALKQRNALLKKKLTAQLSSWDMQLAISGLYLIQARKQCIEKLAPILTDYHSLLSPQEHEMSIEYIPSMNVSSLDDYKACLQKNLDKDLLYQNTNVGPHRDDFSVKLDGRHAKTYASEGQKRTCLAALKCSEWKLLYEQADSPPLFCVDDCPAHLDEVRTKRFVETLLSFPQVILTAPSSTQFPADLFAHTINTAPETASSL